MDIANPSLDFRRIIRLSLICAAIALCVSLPFGALIHYLFGNSAAAEEQVSSNKWLFFVMSIFIAPFLETYIIVICNIVLENTDKAKKLVISSLVFALVHFVADIEKVLSVAIPAVVFCYGYYYLGRTRKESYWIAATTHFIHNLVVVSIAVIFVGN
ncbi:CPBP family intramembrane glutamic endopeptidase [Collimonas humicola]|uniref:CPBP family intramembrane glutamic endopeptidase n=1 Tax=Collimonas humicola TaxID=2825886 RepID=UPI001B8D7670|nr:CPBP family intramembrane glutamic endopeptidase [Collimonas humicola]